ncbi:hypothetical protein ANO11243_011300 [Dothideomycetidae sp. 11243]|nr:hypothetical protein ANO11243_011300 [fungal sp. No.11243]
MAPSDHDLSELRDAIEACPIIDNHAHNLLRSEKLGNHSLLECVTEARGEALKDTPRSLAHLRAIKQLRELYECEPTATWDDLLKKRAQILAADPDTLHRKCLADIHTILIDDGIDNGKTVHSVKWHDQFTTGKNRRIVRIETLAAEIMRAMYEEGSLPLAELNHFDAAAVWPVFLQAFENALADEIRNHNVAGFKSVVCYRTGLDVFVADEISVATAGEGAFRKYIRGCARGNYRIQQKGLNDCLVISACKLIAANYKQNGVSKPIQFHTGLGDNDISLLKSNPAHLQPLIAAFPTVNFVLLHSSYPYTREAGYLATVYKNAYLDVGEIFPMVSIEGQISAIKQSMELTPFSKLLWSTDGHHFPETYYLANRQFKQVLYRVFKDLLAEDVLTLSEAKEAIQDILWENSNSLYNLKVTFDTKTSVSKKRLALLPPPSTGDSSNPKHKAVAQPIYDTHCLSSYFRTPYGKTTSYFLVQWIDYLGTLRCRSYPTTSFNRLVQAGNRIGISRGNLHTLQDDAITPAVNTTGQIYVEPDLSTLRPIHWKDLQGAATAISSFKTADGTRLDECPRSVLQTLADRLRHQHGLEVLVGFELEVTFLHLPANSRGPSEQNSSNYAPIESIAAHAWGTLSPTQAHNTWPLIVKLVEELQSVGIPIEHFHSESGQGQYEFVLPALPLVTAVDVLYQTRQAIQLKAHRWGLRATFHPMPSPGIGNGMHAHISLNPEASFWSAILSSLRGICAFTLPSQESYSRVADDHWTGGTWIAWGTDNRETPLRRVVGHSTDRHGHQRRTERWEVRCLDAMGNMYLALAAIMGAGMAGLQEERKMVLRDCLLNPSKMSPEQLSEHGIEERMPKDQNEALEALSGSKTLRNVFGDTCVDNYIIVRKAEGEKLAAMTEEGRRTWLIERY